MSFNSVKVYVFLTLLVLQTNSHMCFNSKGLIEADRDVMPYAKHRQCARHIYENYKEHFTCVEFTSKASYPVLLQKVMDKYTNQVHL